MAIFFVSSKSEYIIDVHEVERLSLRFTDTIVGTVYLCSLLATLNCKDVVRPKMNDAGLVPIVNESMEFAPRSHVGRFSGRREPEPIGVREYTPRSAMEGAGECLTSCFIFFSFQLNHRLSQSTFHIERVTISVEQEIETKVT